MSESRHRAFSNEVAHTGSLYWITWRYRTHKVGESGTCDDTVGNFAGANPLTLYRRFKKTPVLNGTLTINGEVTRKFVNYPMGYSVNVPPDPRVRYPLPNLIECNNKAWEILAGTNPGSPHVNVFSVVGEMKDIPSLIRDWGRGKIRDIAKGYLSWRWALKPMIGDIMKMCRFVDVANERFRQLRNLRDKKTLKFRVGLGTDHYQDPFWSSVTLNSDGAIVNGSRYNVYKRKMWGSAEWKIRSDSVIVDMEDAELMKFTRNNMLGLNTFGALEAAWELCPWSWFIDWFSSVGDMLAASNNSVGCTWGRLCLMQTTTSEVRFRVKATDKPSWVTLSGDFDWRVVRKDRQVVYPAIPFPIPRLPILTSGKLSILAALAALRR